MYFLAYRSSATNKINDDNLIDILIESRRRNSQKNITGILLYLEGNLIQIIEGEEHDVIQLFSKIEQDRRHYSIIKIAEGEIPERIFKDWSMGFKSGSFEELEQFTGFTNLSKDTFLPSELEASDHEAVKVLKKFYENYQKGG